MGCTAESCHIYDGDWAHSNCSNNLRFESEGFLGGQDKGTDYAHWNLYGPPSFFQKNTEIVLSLGHKEILWWIPIVQPTKCTCYLKLFILVKCSTCFGRSSRPSSGTQNCVYSNGICQTAAAIRDSSSCFIYTVAVYTVLSSWWWTERSSETCRAFYKNK